MYKLNVLSYSLATVARALAVQPESCISMLKIMYLVIPFALDAVITFILSRMKVEEANATGGSGNRAARCVRLWKGELKSHTT